MNQAQQLAGQYGGAIEQCHNINRLPRNVDAVYATRWQTMGVSHPDPHWIDKFRPFCITPKIMANVSKSDGAVFLHDLPAVRGEDVHAEVLDGPQSLAWKQARHKMFSAMAILEWCLGG
jgi:ornithine carbamoyltransferase